MNLINTQPYGKQQNELGQLYMSGHKMTMTYVAPELDATRVKLAHIWIISKGVIQAERCLVSRCKICGGSWNRAADGRFSIRNIA